MKSDPGGVDETGLRWCVAGGAAAVTKEWFYTLVSIMSAAEADRVAVLRRSGFTVEPFDLTFDHIYAEHSSGILLGGDRRLLVAALCYWAEWDPEFVDDMAQHARQKAAFDGAYEAVQAVGLAALGEPTMQGRDGNERRHQWSVWRVADVLVAVYQAVGDVQFGLSVQSDVCSYPADAPLKPTSPFVDWMWDEESRGH